MKFPTSILKELSGIEEGNDSDAIFIKEDVEKVLSIDAVPFTDDMKIFGFI